MQGGPTPAGETSPLNIIETPCVPDIQQTTIGSNKNSRGGSTISNIAPDITEISSSELHSDDRSLRVKGNRIATILLVSHIVEVVVMVLATLLRFISDETNKADNSPFLVTEPGSKGVEDISPALLWLHVVLLTIPLMVVTIISLNWVLRVQDFSGKIVARLVCWILHLFQSSLVWRFLKLQIAYDPGDLTELGMLRFIQIHIHIVPFLVLHVAITVSYPRSLGIALSLALALLLSIVTTITVSTLNRQSSSASTLVPSSLTQMYPVTFNNTNASFKHEDSKSHLLIGATTICLLWSRIVSIAALFCLHVIWAICLIVIHWILAVIWLGFQKDPSSNDISLFRQIIRKSFLGFLLLWDWHIFDTSGSSSKACVQPHLPVIYYTIVASQNVAATSAWFVTKQFQGIPLLYTIVLTSVIISQIFALLLLSLSYMYYSPDIIKWFSKKHTLSISRKPSSLVTPTTKANSNTVTPKICQKANADSVIECTSHVNSEELEKNDSFKKSSSICQHQEEELTKMAEVKNYNKDKISKGYPLPLTPRLMSNHLHSSMFSYANDIHQHTLKSEISSTDNGSFNSRNTNTLPTPGALIPDFEAVHRPHGSFSDSFSSLSCGTVSKAMASTPKGNINSSLYLNDNNKRLKHRKSCQKRCCQGSVIDQLSHPCAGLREEQDEVSIREGQTHDQVSFISLEKEISPPRVALVRATQRFQVVCTKCLYAHDPLLTKCRVSHLSNGPPSLSYSCGGELGALGGSSSTGYPSDTEITTTIDTLSSVSADSHSTYTTWPVGKGPGLAKLLMREKGGHEYVTAWLRHQQNDPETQKKSNKNKANNQNKDSSKCYRQHKRNSHRTRLRASPAFIQDLETVV